MKYILTNKLFFSIFLVGAILVAVCIIILGRDTKKPYISLAGKEIFVEIVETPEEQQRGLGGRERLEQGYGMLFLFEEPELYSFWMKDMLFPIDIIWFDEHRHIVDVRERVAPSTYPEFFTPHTPAKFVLEVPAGFFSENHLTMGNMFEIIR